jgi:hypothetical protein
LYSIHQRFSWYFPAVFPAFLMWRRTWRTFEQNAQPPPEVKKATALVVAGNPEQGILLFQLRDGEKSIGKA